MADTQRMDFDAVKAQASRIGAEALNVSDGTDAGWDGTVRGNPNELEGQFNTQMTLYAEMFRDSRKNLNASLQQLFDGLKNAMVTYEQNEQAVAALVHNEGESLPDEAIAQTVNEQMDEAAKKRHDARMTYERMEDTNMSTKRQAEFDDLADPEKKK